MNFDFTEEQIMIRQAARDYAERELIKDVLERDAKAEIPWKHIKNLTELGFFGMMVDPNYGGGGMDTMSYVLAIEEISKVDAAMSVIMSIHNSLACYGVEKYGSDELKKKYLHTLAAGRRLVLSFYLNRRPDQTPHLSGQWQKIKETTIYSMAQRTGSPVPKADPFISSLHKHIRS